nr:putative E3 ubiquitin-protein ligase RF298 [Ipomoea batatas]
MSNSDSQNASARDYNDVVETTPIDESSANSTRSPREDEVAGDWEGDENPRRGKSPRVVLSHFYDLLPAYSPTSRDALQRTLPPLPASSQAVSAPEVEEYPTATRALKNAVVKISTESYEYWIFQSPASVKAADLEPLDYTQSEKYFPKRAIAPTLPAPASEPTNQGRGQFRLGRVTHSNVRPAILLCYSSFLFAEMVLERSFAPASIGSKKPRPKVTLGGNKVTQPSETPTGIVPSTLPSGSIGAAPESVNFQIIRAPSKRGKEKATDLDVEEIAPQKKLKRPKPRGSTPVLDALREGGEQTANLLEKIRTIIPTREAIRDLETDQVGEMIAQNVLWVSFTFDRYLISAINLLLCAQLSHMTNDLLCRAKAAENVVQAMEGRIAQAEKEVDAAKREAAEMNEKMSNYANLSGFLCRDPKEAKAFFRAFLYHKVGEGLAWRYGEWAYAKGQHTMQQEVQEALIESLNERDLAAITEIMPDVALRQHEERDKIKNLQKLESIRSKREQWKRQVKAEEDNLRAIAESNRLQYEERKCKLIEEISALKLAAASRGQGGVKREWECTICLTKATSVAFLPCAHQVLCKDCNTLHENQGMKDCPSCRTPIVQRIHARFPPRRPH